MATLAQRMKWRPLNTCNRCAYTWHPRGHSRSNACPSCGCRDVAIPTDALATGLAGVATAVVAVFLAVGWLVKAAWTLAVRGLNMACVWLHNSGVFRQVEEAGRWMGRQCLDVWRELVGLLDAVRQGRSVNPLALIMVLGVFVVSTVGVGILAVRCLR